MKNYSIIDKIEFSIKYNKSAKIHSKNGKIFWADIFSFDNGKIEWYFKGKRHDGTELKLMNISNISDLSFELEDNKEFLKYIKCKNSGIEDDEALEANLQNLFEYYKLILRTDIESLDSAESLNEEEEIEKASLENKINLLEVIQKNLFQSEDDLLFPFISSGEFNNNIIDSEDRPILLFSKSNASQKSAIEKSLSEKISFIEGPPGTGKTTTILSIIANLLYRNQKTVVVSKNNSAIDNIGEELDKLDLPKIYVRLGNSKYTTDLFKNILVDINNYHNQVKDFNKIDDIELFKFNLDYDEVRKKELKLNELMKKKNELEELENQKRHIEKRQEAYGERFSGKLPFCIKFLQIDKLCLIIDRVSSKIEKYNDRIDINISIIDKIIAVLFWHIKAKDFFKQYLFLKWELESIFLTRQISEINKYIKNNNLEELKKEINALYENSYCQKSINLFKQSLLKYYYKDDIEFSNLIKEIETFKEKFQNEIKKNSYDSEFLKEKSRIIQIITDFFPLTLTTADSLPSNFYNYRNGKLKFDYLIMDEATQCDVISGIAALFYTKNCVISGDSKQLSAITGENCLDIDDSY